MLPDADWETTSAERDRDSRRHPSDRSFWCGDLRIAFNDSGLIDTVQAEARGRMVNGDIIPTPWKGRFWNYVERDGMRIPLDGEVAWLLPTGPKPYWRGRISEIAHDCAQ